MPAETYVNVAGVWRKIPTNGIYAHAGGGFQQANFGYVKDAGVWRTVYIRDNTGPAAPTGAYAQWTTTNATPTGVPSLYIQWNNPPDADYAYMQVILYPGNQPYLAGPQIAYNGNPTQGFHYTQYIINNAVYGVQLIPYDNNGNPGTSITIYSNAWCGWQRGRSPSPNTEIYCIDSGTYQVGVGWKGGLATYRVYQGDFEGRDNYGMWFYGNQFLDKMAGSQLQYATFEMFRVNSIGNAGAVIPTAYFSPHMTSKAVVPVGQLFEPYDMKAIPRNGSDVPYFQNLIHGNWWDNVVTGNPAGTIRAISFKAEGSSRRSEWYGFNDAPGWVVPGRVICVHNG